MVGLLASAYRGPSGNNDADNPVRTAIGREVSLMWRLQAGGLPRRKQSVCRQALGLKGVST